jgi:hypothetical protein
LVRWEGGDDVNEPHLAKGQRRLKRFVVSQDGPTAVEYAVIQALGTNANATFTTDGNSLWPQPYGQLGVTGLKKWI